MAQYCDPIAYNFSFKAITGNDVEPKLKAAFRELVTPFLDCILEYGGFGGPPCKGLTPNYIWITFGTKDNMPMDVPSQILCPKSGRTYEENEIYPAEESRAEAEAHLLEALNALDDPRCQCMDIWIDDKHSRRRYYGRPTKIGKKLDSMIVKPVEREELRKHTDELFRLLSCPSDDLSDVRVPASGLYGESIYNVSYMQMAIPIPNIKLIADIPDDGKQYVLHNLSINIPRFLAAESVDIPFVQRLWTEKLRELGKIFPLCLGSADMDQSHPNGFSAFDRANGANIYFSERIPGYAWAMLVNATQRKKIHVPASGEIPGFYQTTEFDNGNLFFQKTADIRFMTWEDCHSLREYFKPSLTPAPLEHAFQTTFPSYRAGFLVKDIDFDMKLRPCSDFAVRHDRNGVDSSPD